MRLPMTAAVVALAAACSDPTITVTLDFAGETELKGNVADFDVSVYALADAAACDRIALGEYSQEELDVAFRTMTRGRSEAVALDDVPRLGGKAVVYRGRGGNGRLIAGGCAPLGDVDSDSDGEVVLRIEPTLFTRLVIVDPAPTSLALPSTRPVALIARKRFSNGPAAGVTFDGKPVFSSRLRDDRHELEFGAVVPSSDPQELADGIHYVEGLDQAPAVAGAPLVGPLELTVRARWSDAAQQIAAYVPPALHQVVELGSSPNQQAPSWVLFDRELDGSNSGTEEVAAALYRGPTDSTARLKIFVEEGDRLIQKADHSVEDAVALTVHSLGNGADLTKVIVASTSTGWYYVDPSDPTRLIRGAAPAAGRADQLQGLADCRPTGAAQTNAGMIGLVGATAIATFRVNTVTGPGDLSAMFAEQLQVLLDGGGRVTLLGSSCAVLEPGENTRETPVVAVRVQRDSFDQVYFLVPGSAPVLTPFLGAVARLGDTASVVGAAQTADGLHATSYRFKVSGETPLFIPDGVVDHPLPAAPIDLSAFDVSGDGRVDAVALVRIFDRLAISMAVATAVPGEIISALLPAANTVPSDDYKLRRLRLGAGLQVAVAGPRGLLIWDPSRPEQP